MLTCLVVFNMSVGTSREMVRCEYCSQEMRRKNMKEHTENVHGKGVPIKVKTIGGQSFMSSFFKRKNDDKAIDEGESLSKVPTFNEAMLDKVAEEDEVTDDVRN